MADIKRDAEVDSLTKKSATDSLQWHHEKDSLVKVNVVLFHQKDSFQKISDAGKQSLSGKDGYISSLVDRINEAEANKNDSVALAACDSLKAQYPIVRQIAASYINANDSLKTVNDSIVKFKDGIIARLSGLYAESNNSLFETSRLYRNQGEELKAARKQQNKRWSIGPGVGMTYINGGFKPIVNIGLHYDIIRF